MPADRSKASRRDIVVAGNSTSESVNPPSPTVPSGGIAFAPNVTPGTFNNPPVFEDEAPCDSLLFPAQDASSLPARKSGHSRKKPENYIPRPPNAFILFRSSFIRSQHVSTDVETNHSTLSKIIGLTWQNLPNEERQIWHRKAKIAEEQHKIKFPQYAFKPLHTKNKANGRKRKVREVGPKDHKRCARIAELLVQGKKGEDLDDAIKEFDKHHVPEVVHRFEAPITVQSFQRSYSAPVLEVPAGPSRKPRAPSSIPSRHSTPATMYSSPSMHSTSSLPDHLQDVEQDAAYFDLPSFDHFSFTPKDESSLDFNSFAFTSSLHSSTPLYQFDTHSQAINPLEIPFSHPDPQSNLLPPHLSINASFAQNVRSWSPCNSPMSPSTSSMPTTPAYAGSPPPPHETYETYTLDAGPNYALDNDKSFNNMPQFATYEDPNSMYSGPAHHFVDPHNGGYSPTEIKEPRPQLAQVELDYSAFMASIPPYSL